MARPTVDPVQFLEEFFGPGVPEDIQDDYRESFRITQKVDPEKDARAFRDFVVKQAANDKFVRDILQSAATERQEGMPSADDSSSQGPSTSFHGSVMGVGLQGGDDGTPTGGGSGSLPIETGLIFSASLGPQTAAKALNASRKHQGTTRATTCIHNSHLDGPSPHPAPSGIDWSVHLAVPPERCDSSTATSYDFLHTDPDTYSDCLDQWLSEVIRRITDRWKQLGHHEDLQNIIHVGDTAQTPSIVIGRIVCDSEGPLNEQSALLEGTRLMSRTGRVAQLYLRQVPRLLIFPGQVVALKGIAEADDSTRISKFIATQIYEGVDCPPPLISSKRLKENSAQFVNSAPVHLCAAGGPFSDSGVIDYSRLNKFFTAVAEVKPNVCVLFGPFLDAANHLVKCGDLKTFRRARQGRAAAEVGTAGGGADEQHVAEEDGPPRAEWLAYDELYSTIGQMIRQMIPTRTRVVLVPHPSDVSHPFPLPQPPFSSSLFWPPSATSSPPFNVELLSNPASISINGIHIALTSTDPITPIATSAVCRGHQGNKFDLFCRQLLTQQSFFPVVPPPHPMEPSRFATSLFHWPHAAGDFALPNIFLFPVEKIPPFAKQVEARLFVNCGQTCSPGAPHIDMWLHPPAAISQNMDSSIENSSAASLVADEVAKRVRVDLSRSR